MRDQETHATAAERATRRGREPQPMRVGRVFGDRYEGDVWDSAGKWNLRTPRIVGADGEVVFEQQGVLAPESWSELAVRVVAQKYFRGTLGTAERESSIRDLIDRVARTIADWGRADGYLETDADRAAFYDDLVFLLLNQYAAFNSPVWFNVGVEERPQCSACFIQSVDDSMESILDLAKNEGMLFKYGSGTGSNFSRLRGRNEGLRGGGTASGPVSFMKGYDAFAGVIKSGGKTRRAAKMVILDADHPDVLQYVDCKALEEEKARKLVDAGYEGGIDGEAYASVFFQNANHSVRVTDEFMRAVEADEPWDLVGRRTGEVVETVRARDLFDRIVKRAWQCGDPGLQFDTTINAWHTSPTSGRINGSNPCSEYMYLDDSACNLASLNLRRFQREDGSLDSAALRSAVDVVFLAQEILVDRAAYPTEAIAENSHRFRPIGLGYANLGAFLMAAGLPYDSDEGRATAGAITSLMQGSAAAVSAKIAEARGAFDGYAENRAAYLAVMRKHRAADLEAAPARLEVEGLKQVSEAAGRAWDEAIARGERTGFRNGQLSVLAPTGTIAFMMDCDTTGVEPDIALRKTKALVGGGSMTYVNQTVTEALARLGYDRGEANAIWNHVREHGTVEGAEGLRGEHLPVFDCAFPASEGGRSIHWRGHVKMMAAVQPFVSGAISKTVNLPADATEGDVEAAYLTAWELGLKAIAVYRDGSKVYQPLETRRAPEKAGNGSGGAIAFAPVTEVVRGREKLPRTRASFTHKFDIGGHEGYVTIGLYADGRVGEMFIRMAKEGSTISGLMDAFATSVSIALQYGVPLEVLASKFARTRFEPSGFSSEPEIGYASSVLDYIFRWLEGEFPGGRRDAPSVERRPAPRRSAESILVEEVASEAARAVGLDCGPPCPDCGSIMEPNGACHRCANCGTTNGCS